MYAYSSTVKASGGNLAFPALLSVVALRWVQAVQQVVTKTRNRQHQANKRDQSNLAKSCVTVTSNPWRNEERPSRRLAKECKESAGSGQAQDKLGKMHYHGPSCRTIPQEWRTIPHSRSTCTMTLLADATEVKILVYMYRAKTVSIIAPPKLASN